jgi:hypothetical protein
MPGQIKIDDGSGNYTVLTNGGSLGSDKTITIPNTTGTMALTSDSFGKVLQVVEGTYSTATSNTTTSYADTNLTASITPSAITSKILVIVKHNVQLSRTATEVDGGIQLLRDATQISFSYMYQSIGGATSVIWRNIPVMLSLDSPSTTSSVTYKTQAKLFGSTSGSHTITTSNFDVTDTIILIEVDGS